jgi:predicted secreted protein
MFNKKAFCALTIALLLGLSGLWAGDTATFVDLGFSPDGKIFMFGQYGVQSGTLRPWADLFIVDVERNNFVSGGRSSFLNDRPVVSGQDGSGALYRLIAQNAALATRYNIDYCFQGQPLFIALDTKPNDLPRAIEFRDFENGIHYRASLVSHVEGSGTSLRSSFHIDLERTTRDGARRTYRIGTPLLQRPLITAYHIRKVMIAPHDGSMIFVIAMITQDGDNFDVRYMVEAVRL